MRTGALIIASGATSGSTALAPMQPVGDVSAVQRLIMTFRLASAEPVAVVCGPDSEGLERHAGKLEAVFLQNPDPGAEMLDNVQLGLEWIRDKCEQVLITPVNVPLFTVETVQILMQSGKELAIPVCAGERGHPLLAHGSVIPSLLQYTDGNGLRGAVESCGHPLAYVEVADMGVIWGLSDQAAPGAIAEQHDLRRPRADVRVCIAKEKVYWGPGVRQLLTLIESTGSVRLACQQMGMSYSKGWKLLGTLEEQVGFQVAARQQGGRGGGEAHLTAQGKALLERYSRFERACKSAVGELFRQYFAEELSD